MADVGDGASVRRDVVEGDDPLDVATATRGTRGRRCARRATPVGSGRSSTTPSRRTAPAPAPRGRAAPSPRRGRRTPSPVTAEMTKRVSPSGEPSSPSVGDEVGLRADDEPRPVEQFGPVVARARPAAPAPARRAMTPSRAARSTSRHSTRARSTWRRNGGRGPCPRWRPRSARGCRRRRTRWSSSRRTTPRFGSSVVNG